MSVLVVNAGSSSLKLRLLGQGDAVLRQADLPALSESDGRNELARTLGGWPQPDVVAHRVVHGGSRFHGPQRIDAGVRAALEELVELAPLHQPKSLAGIDAVAEALPDVPGWACFDTAFHATIPAAAATYAVPWRWQERYGLRRYGFHGLSHAYCARRAAEMARAASRPCRRLVTCHIGAGASLTAVLDGRSLDTTMGFTPLEGLVMATRSGSVDPGLLLWLEEHEGLSPHEIAHALEHESGLLALAGTADLREVEARRAAGDERAILAFEVYLHRLVTAAGAMAVAAGGLDALVFTGGVGQHSAAVRAAMCDRLALLGVALDPEANAAHAGSGDADVTGSAAAGAPSVLVLEAREDLQMAREIRAASAGEPGTEAGAQ